MTIIQVKNELSFYTELDSVLRTINEQIEFLGSHTARAASSFSHAPSRSRNPHSLESRWADYAEAGRLAAEARIEIEQIRQSISMRIAKLPPDEHYLLFMRHIKKLSFSEISKKKCLSERTIYRHYTKTLDCYASEYEKPLLTDTQMRGYIYIGMK